MEIEEIIYLLERRIVSDAIVQFQEKKNNEVLKPLVYTSFDGDYMPFLSDILTYTKNNGYIPVNPEAALGYYVSTKTHDGNKVFIMKDCICEELLCDEMWIFNPTTDHIPEGVTAEIMAWKRNKKSNMRKIPFFNNLNLNVDIHSADLLLDNYFFSDNDIDTYLESCNKDDIEDIKEKLFNVESNISRPVYVVANFYNYKHIDWTREYCYKNGLCPVSPQNILPFTLYNKEKNFLSYIIDRLTILNKCSEIIWFTNERNIKAEVDNLDIFSCTELYYGWKFNKQLIKIVDWATAGVPKYIDSKKWALTRTESRENIPNIKNIETIQRHIFTYEKNIKNEFNIFKGGLLKDDECDFVTHNMNAFIFGLISDSSVKAETAWSLPYRLYTRLGHFDLNKIKNIEIEDLADIIRTKPALHRYPANIAKYLHAAAELLLSSYQGDAANIWNEGASAEEIIMRLESFKGISHKKAALGTLLLVRDLNIEINDKENINLAYDIHIRRICLRTGFCKKDTIEEVTNAGRKIYPEFPGRLTSSFCVVSVLWMMFVNIIFL